ncbi:MAG TPA: AAA family ATPase [Candidatus Blautia faecigallinarum]|uniref:AAA family ATPase n=1 Tax=Candidatus Blautia faecigallinarum TaxID=2838488 RepID=A0A9D2DUR8_9FIRM|nr:AAA family ATPase [Candidatus Blautia faecigallinarum]
MIQKKNGREFLPYVLENLKKRIEEIDASILEGEKDIEEMHEYYWENYTEMDQYGYEDFDNRQALLNRINANQESILLRRRLKKMLDSPFFGRVDFCYEGEEEEEIFYIGIGNFAARTGGVPLVYDWRAPVCSLFYDYDKGTASYLAPQGEIFGEIKAKWQYKIRRGKMLYQFESDIKIDDEILKEELGSNGTVQLKNIVRTIQKEQNAIIRNQQDKVLVIQGAAGSGKTSVALHRIAYLLYHDRKNLKSSNILILSPNSAFSDYISHILPELGEENIQEMSFDLFAYQQLKDTIEDCEDRYEYLERRLWGIGGEDLYQEKQSREFINKMEGYLLSLEDELMGFKDVSYKGFVKTEGEIIQLFYFKFMELPLLSRMEAVAEYFIDEIETLRGKDLPDEDREAVLGKFFSMYETRDLYVLYSRFLEQEGYPPLPPVPREKRRLKYEDVYPLLYLKYRLLTQTGHSRIKHLVVDEMQDYSRLQYLLLKKIFSCRMTILGDKAQTIDDKAQDVFTFLPEILGKDIKKISMNKSYRNTAEISQYANRLVHLTDIEVFNRHGRPVTEKQAASMEEALEEIWREIPKEKERFETAAVITRTEAEAISAYGYLCKKAEQEGEESPELSLLDRNSTSFKKGVTVLAFYLAKGLEFDQVFSLFPAEKRSALDLQGRYIAATRALHELSVYEIGPFV